MSDPRVVKLVVEKRPNGVIIAAIIFVSAWLVFAHENDAEPRFMDEVAFLSQTFYWDLARSGRWNDPRWLDYAAYDVPPLPKYLIGAALQARSIPRPDWIWSRSWYEDAGVGGFVSPEMLRVARWPSLLLGAMGCTALFAIGTLAADRRVGILAALFLMANPLFRLHARRAMADVPAEAFVLAALALGLAAWERRTSGRWNRATTLVAILLAGVAAGLAVLAKLTGGMALMVLATWALVAFVALPWGLWPRLAPLLAMIPLGLVAVLTFIAMNPFVTTRPAAIPRNLPLIAPKPRDQTIGRRLLDVIRHRVDVSRTAPRQFPHDALISLADKGAVLAVQGFGRFGPFGPRHSDSTRRFDWKQDWGAIPWLLLVVLGGVATIRRGGRLRREGSPPLPYAILAYFLVAAVTVGLFLPLAWDRYLLPVQAASSLMAAYGVASLWDACRPRVQRS